MCLSLLSPSSSLTLHGWTCTLCHSFAGAITHGQLGLSGARGASSDSQARDQFCGSSHISFPGKNLADLPPRQGFPSEAELNSSNQ